MKERFLDQTYLRCSIGQRTGYKSFVELKGFSRQVKRAKLAFERVFEELECVIIVSLLPFTLKLEFN
jgi:hypothetical protein